MWYDIYVGRLMKESRPVSFGGPGWTRTNDGKTGGFTVRCHCR